MRGLTYWAILAAIWLPCQALAGPRFTPDCAGPVEVKNAHVAKVEKNGTLVLADGGAVVLEGVRLPGADGAPAGLADAAFAFLGQMSRTEAVNFAGPPPEKDRYGRIRAQGFGAVWFQTALLEQGLARVEIAPDRSECAPDLYEAEARARARHIGLWALAAYAPRTPQTVRRDEGRFEIVEGKLSHIGHGDGRTFLDFAGGDFSAVIEAEDRRAFHGFDLEALLDRPIRVRGIVGDFHGRPQLNLSNPSQIEVMDR